MGTFGPGQIAIGPFDIATETTLVLRWDNTGSLASGDEAQLLIDGVEEASTTGTFAAADSVTTLNIGNYRTPANAYAFDGFIQRIRIWDGERA